ncbi:MAG: RidA family protein [Chloroflexi bacterium]|nr:RidA family protein [Ardenticatenaceae bacterium]MBL1130506.1 RidA family protein [Chloroflexota bacterium]NOG36596.1 RidA family protein [Chloroflexota bacterium]
MGKTIISTDKAPAAIGPYSQAVRTGNLLFTAGQVGLDPTTGNLVEGGVQAQTERAMQNLQAVLAAAGATFANVVKTTVFLADMADFAVMNEVYGRYVTPNPPARSTFQVAALPRGALVEIEMIAVIEE